MEEYYLFDPREEYLKPRFRTYHRMNNQFVPVVGDEVASLRLNLTLLSLDGELRFRDPKTGLLLLSPARAAGLENRRADRERHRAEEASHRESQRAKRADAESQRADRERQRADLEHRRAQRMAQKLRELGIEPD